MTEALANSTQDTIATKEDVADPRAELKEDIAELRADLIGTKAAVKGDIAGLKGELIRWIVLNLFGTAGLVIASTRILAHQSSA